MTSAGAYSKVIKSAVVCDLCDSSVKVRSKCVDCNERLCDHCRLGHQRSKLSKHHKIVPLNSKKDVDNSSRQCKEHTKRLNVFCNTCAKPICDDCVLDDHKNHDFVKVIESARSRRQDGSNAFREATESYIRKLQSGIKKCQEIRTENINHESRTVKSINDRKDEFVELVWKMVDEMVQECKKQSRRIERNMERMNSDLSGNLFELESMYGEYNRAVESQASTGDLMKLEHHIKTKINQISMSDIEPNVTFSNFVPGDECLLEMQNLFGNLEKRIEDCDSQETGNVQANAEIKIISKFKHQADDIGSVCPITADTAWVSRDHGDEHEEIHLLDTKGRIQKKVKPDWLVNVFAVTAKGYMYVSSYDLQAVKKVSYDCSNITDFLEAKPLRPYGMGICRNGDLLICMIDSNSYNLTVSSCRRVVRVTKKGKLVKTMEFENGKHLFTKPYRVAQNPSTLDIWVVDRTSDDSGRLCILDNTGPLKSVYKGNQIGHSHFCPMDMECDDRGNVIVCDACDKIHILSSKGRLLQYITTDKYWIQKPLTLALKDGCLWVGCEEGNVYILQYPI